MPRSTEPSPRRPIAAAHARGRFTHSARRVAVGCVLSLASSLALVAAPAPAQSAEGTSQIARDLFERGRAHWTAGEYEEAAALLAASHQQSPRAGTLLLMADAYERLGRLRSARDTFARAGALAHADGNAGLEHRARTREAALLPRLPALEVRLLPPVPRGLLVTLDGAELPAAELNVPTALDAGHYRLEASAPGYQPFSLELELSNERQQPLGARVVSISLVRASGDAGSDPFDPQRSRRTLGLWIGGAGTAVALASAVSMLVSLEKNGASRQRCGLDVDASNADENVCSPRGVALRDQARTLAHVATAGAVLGLAGVGTGLAVYFSKGSAHEPDAASVRWSAAF